MQPVWAEEAPLWSACLACQTACLAAIVEVGVSLAPPMCQALPALMQQCVNACELVLLALARGRSALLDARECADLCLACGQALQQASGFQDCVCACLGCDAQCRYYADGAQSLALRNAGINSGEAQQ